MSVWFWIPLGQERSFGSSRWEQSSGQTPPSPQVWMGSPPNRQPADQQLPEAAGPDFPTAPLAVPPATASGGQQGAIHRAPPPAPTAALASPLSNVHRITRLASLFFVTFMVVLLTGPLIYLLIYLFMPLRTPFLLQRKSAHLVLCGKDICTF